MFTKDSENQKLETNQNKNIELLKKATNYKTYKEHNETNRTHNILICKPFFQKSTNNSWNIYNSWIITWLVKTVERM